MKVNFNAAQTTQTIQDSLLAKVLEDAWEKMSEDDRKKLIDDAGNVFGAKVGGIGVFHGKLAETDAARDMLFYGTRSALIFRRLKRMDVRSSPI